MAKKSSRVSQLNVGLELEQQLKKEIFDFLQYDAVSVVMDNVKFWEDCIHRTKSEFFTSSIHVSNDLMEPLYNLLLLAKDRLGFKEEVDLYVVTDNNINASAYYSYDKNEPHLIAVNSGMINSLTDNEILGVIGHEIGHLIFQDIEMNRLVAFVYGDESVPRYIDGKLMMLSQLHEIRCDRCAYIACGELDASITAQFMMMCGVNYSRFGGDVKGLLSRSRHHVECMCNGDYCQEGGSHPDSPIRVTAMEIFATTTDTSELKKEMKPIVELVNLWKADPMDKYYADYIVSAGLMIANFDGKITDEEINAIISNVVNYELFPIKSYKKIDKMNKQSYNVYVNGIY